jgi:hypothetical protein
LLKRTGFGLLFLLLPALLRRELAAHRFQAKALPQMNHFGFRLEFILFAVIPAPGFAKA